MKKLIISLLLAASAGLSFAQNSVEYCTSMGLAAFQSAHARRQGMPKEIFDKHIAEIEKDLSIDPKVRKDGVKALRRGFDAPLHLWPEEIATEVYEDCKLNKI